MRGTSVKEKENVFDWAGRHLFGEKGVDVGGERFAGWDPADAEADETLGEVVDEGRNENVLTMLFKVLQAHCQSVFDCYPILIRDVLWSRKSHWNLPKLVQVIFLNHLNLFQVNSIVHIRRYVLKALPDRNAQIVHIQRPSLVKLGQDRVKNMCSCLFPQLELLIHLHSQKAPAKLVNTHWVLIFNQ